jgi:hypothetical protein
VISPSPASATTNTSGVATFTATDSTAETVVYTAKDITDGVTLSQTATVEFQGAAVPVSGSKSTVTAPSTADTGGAGAVVTVTLLGADGVTPVAGKTVTLAASSANASVGAASGPSGANGQVQFDVSDLTAESVTFTATDETDSLPITQTATVVFSAPSLSTSQSTVAVTPDSVPADGTTQATVSVALVDNSGLPLAGQTVQLTTNSGASASITPDIDGGLLSPVTNSEGIAKFLVLDEVAETVTFTALDETDGGAAVIQTASVTFTVGIGDAGQSTLTASPTTVALNGSSTITVTVLDHLDNPVPNKVVTLSASSGSSSTISPNPASVTTNSSGVATFSVTDGTAQAVTYSAIDSTDQVSITQTATVTFGTPNVMPSAADSVIVSSAASVPADGTSSATVTVTLYDVNGLPVSGKTVELTPSGGSSVIAVASATGAAIRVAPASRVAGHAAAAAVSTVTNSAGSASFTVTDTAAETVTYTATDITDNLPITGQSVQVAFTAASSTTTTTTASGTSTGAAGTTTTTAASGANSTSVTSAGDDDSDLGLSDGSGGSTASTSSTSSPGLAFTGGPPLLPWLIGIGLCLLAIGTLGRRFVRSNRVTNDA